MSSLFSTPVMLALDVLMVVYTLWVLSLSPRTRRGTGWIGAGLLGWLAILYALLSSKTAFSPEISGLTFFGVILSGVGLFGLVLLGFAPVRRYVLSLDQRQLMVFQGVRIFFGATFLIQGGLGLLPSGFGMIDGLTHISAGFFALIAAFSLSASTQGRRRAWFANLFGLADILIVASSLAFVLLDTIGPHHPMMYAVFLPAPLWLWAHVLSIYQLLTRSDQAFDAELAAESTPGA